MPHLNFVLKPADNRKRGFRRGTKQAFCVSCASNFFIVIVRGSTLL
ncbi:hypothetical protein A464_836 [Salmonella bongori N268-08]|uniref:Uncharacterized protein n=1 Tax=Salmonella bongori N268-08 TaxID=1197719 RepID=S5NCM8_SALBN|nr:hypothetical protein A464_836 [Salmonella bongori N268-08]